MASKLIIFVAFASLAQSSFALPLNISYGLTNKQLPSLTRIIVNQDATVKAKFDGFDPMFHIIGKYSSALVWNVKANSNDDSSEIAHALVRVKNAIDYSLNSVLIALQKSCAAVEVARKATHADLDNAYVVATHALKLAHHGHFSTNRAKLEAYQSKVQKYLASLVSSVYNSIRICMATKDTATLAEIQRAQDGSGLALVHLTNALFSAIKVYSTAVTTGKADVSLIFAIEDFRRHARASLRSDVENKFAALKTIFISTQLNDIAIVTPLGRNQYALTVAFYRHQAEMEIIYSTLGVSLASVGFGIYDDGIVDFSLTNVAQATVSAKLRASFDIFLFSILGLHPTAVHTVAAAQKKLDNIAATVPAIYYEAIAAAGSIASRYNETIAHIENLRKLVLSKAVTYTDLCYKLLRNGQTWDTHSEAAFKKLKKAAPRVLDIVINNIFNSIVIVAKAHHANKATEADCTAIETAAEVSISAFDVFTQYLSAAGVIVIKANKADGW